MRAVVLSSSALFFEQVLESSHSVWGGWSQPRNGGLGPCRPTPKPGLDGILSGLSEQHMA